MTSMQTSQLSDNRSNSTAGPLMRIDSRREGNKKTSEEPTTGMGTSYSQDHVSGIQPSRRSSYARSIRNNPVKVIQLLLSSIAVLAIIWTLGGEDKQRHTQASSATDSSSDNMNSLFANTQAQYSKDVTLIGSMNTAFLPRLSTSHRGHADHDKRLIFIGDIHGCMKELHELLKKLDYKEKHDHIIAAGDMINKGPDSQAVLDFLREKKASCVRGNHDHDVLTIIAEARSRNHVGIQTGEPQSSKELLAHRLTKKNVKYLQSCPLILQVGDIASRNYVVVHGGLVPSLPLDNQDPFSVMNMRIIDSRTHEPSKDHEKAGYIPWSGLWNDYQQRPVCEEGVVDPQRRPSGSKVTTIVYGHDAKSGLQIKEYTKGLDSGCVKGGQLSALVVDGNGNQKLYQVECRNYV